MKKRGAGLVGLMVAIVIIGILFAVIVSGGLGTSSTTVRPDNVGRTVIGQSAARARDEVCINNLHQLRMAIQIQKDQDATPSSLQDIPGIPDSMKKCPIEPHEVYRYDAATGNIFCPHPGHERY